MNLISIPAFQDNYIWLLSNEQRECVIIDPGEADTVLHTLTESQLTPKAILLTHHHNDHVGGVKKIIDQYPELPVYGPQETAEKGCTRIVNDQAVIHLLDRDINVMAVPGHTSGHIAYYTPPYLFCGDTLFSAGCGRLFEGSAQQMYESLQRVAQLPDNTLICCAHEYTLANLRFAQHVLPEDLQIKTYQQQVELIRSKGQPSLPSLLQTERHINLFLRCHDIDLQNKIGITTPPEQVWQVFANLRALKDNFRSF